jgi:serine protease inhibitor
MVRPMRMVAALFALSALVAPAMGAAAPPAQAGTAATTPAEVAAGNRRFALGLFREIARTETGNIFVSPASIAFALGPLTAGATGETRAGIGRALSFPVTGDGLHPALAALQRGLEREGGDATISIANALWLNRGFTPRPAFIETAHAHYDSAVETLDFGGDAEGAAARINHWAETETHGRIPHVVEPSNFSAATRLVVTNAVYFLADWGRTFDPGTEPGPFTQADGRRIDVPLMRQRWQFRHYRGIGFAALDLPYRDERLVMTVLLPDTADGLPELESRLTPAVLDRTLQALDRAQPADVDVALPRLNLRKDYLLNGPLSRLGMGLAFTSRADFSGLSEEPLQISTVKQFTFLRVDERGTEAAAVTVAEAIVITGARHTRPPIHFHVDHPFLFMLRDRESGAILFFGRITRPE